MMATAEVFTPERVHGYYLSALRLKGKTQGESKPTA
jgi:hypothetical protein